ncbi:hypothetical protein PHET_09294 [Paragonimus heterotremus]|uniref:Cyclic nucleotide-binding domain-containing protein n=1 Tax=Paragonimus heterotremus TaxID=100268 RepID=A0A8J4SK81_9TREM|nr:hypothetical protein PHET_09294 [Paragonimus heterotremus]
MHQEYLCLVSVLDNLDQWKLLIVADALKPGIAKVFQLPSESGDPVEVNRLRPLDYFGEIALLHDRPHPVTAVAQSPLRRVRLEPKRLERVISRCSDIWKRNISEYSKCISLSV